MKKKLIFISTVSVLFVSLFILVRLNSITAADFTGNLANLRKKVQEAFDRTRIQTVRTVEEFKAQQSLALLLKKLQVKTVTVEE